MAFSSIFSSGPPQEDTEMYPLNPLSPFHSTSSNNPSPSKDHAMLEGKNSMGEDHEPSVTTQDNLATLQSAWNIMSGALVPSGKPPHLQASPKSDLSGQRSPGPSSQMTIYNHWRSTSCNSDHLVDTVIASPKVQVLEVDYSSSLRQGMYTLKSCLQKTSMALETNKADKELFYKLTMSRYNMLQKKYGTRIQSLEAELQHWGAMLVEEAEKTRALLVEEAEKTRAMLAQRDSVIAQQKLAMEILTKDAEEMECWAMQHAEAAMESVIQRLKADKESEVATLSRKHEMTLHKLHDLENKHSGSAGRNAMPQLIGDHIDDTTPPVPASSGIDVSQSSVPLDSSTVEKIMQEVCWIMQCDSPAPAKIQSRRIYQLKQEIANDKERNANLQHVCTLFTNAFGTSIDEEFLVINGVSHEKIQAFLDGGDEGPDPDDLQWNFNHVVSSGWNKAVISCLIQ
ncbi:hypothetical protein HD554DRAFT_2179639 [Boletus coccyginus]|nr:hypothetical protein HD554DRAFT_2179639 [Boletus coccyginus]